MQYQIIVRDIAAEEPYTHMRGLQQSQQVQNYLYICHTVVISLRTILMSNCAHMKPVCVVVQSVTQSHTHTHMPMYVVQDTYSSGICVICEVAFDRIENRFRICQMSACRFLAHCATIQYLRCDCVQISDRSISVRDEFSCGNHMRPKPSLYIVRQ